MLTARSDVHVHFIGIGGIGMSGIAEILLALGYQVSGSDCSASATVEKLRGMGAEVFIGHKKENVKDATVLVYSSAIRESNPEIVEAKEKRIPIMRRAEMLAELMRLKKGIAIAGTHGKTTTTSLLATILQESKYEPTYIIGGIVDNLKGHAKVGSGEYLIAEADESDGSFLLLNPIMSVITNIDNDHLDHYGTEENLHASFLEFANKIPFYGLCSLNYHDENIKSLFKEMKKPWVTFGISEIEKGADFEARNIKYVGTKSVFDLYYKDEKKVEITLAIPGEHNVLNALGAISIAYNMGLSFEKIANSISKFNGVGRRFQTLFENEKSQIVDDYGHHPTEIKSTLKAARSCFPDKKLIVFFEPHRYTRTKDCWNEFLHCFNYADEVFLNPIYPASEDPIGGISSERLAKDINTLHPELVKLIKDEKHMFNSLDTLVLEESVIVTLGAGSIGKRIREWVSKQKS
ncbi:MAG: UDP-N-acetylmuramate--L-alanine ligase [Bacteriovoracaceae bacterium]|nr:UDP-N-acetylmuramate--L-alanine ligase [Bacteriovoracaceae bacterium]